MNQEENKVEIKVNKPFWKVNFNIWLLIRIVLVFWFIFIHGISYATHNVRAFFIIHLVNASLITILCILNLLHTPSHGPIYRKVHIWLGILFGILSTILGLIVTWYKSYKGFSIFGIAISIGGIIQVISQLLAAYFIRKGNVRKHMFWNHIVFFGGCLTPAIIRFGQLIMYEIPYWATYCWIIVLIIEFLSYRSFLYKTWY